MFKNNLSLAVRHLLKNKSYATINIFGLAVAIAACLLIFQILRFELSFNQKHSKNERIVRVLSQITGRAEGRSRDRGVPLPGMTAIAATVSQFEMTSRVHEDWPTVTVPNPSGGAPLKKMKPSETEVSFFVEPNYLKMFDFDWLAGDAATALNETASIVLTRKLAEFCFQTPAAALGKTVILDNAVPVVVRGVIENPPPNTDFPVFSLTSYSTLRANPAVYSILENEKEWGSTSSNDQFFGLLHDKTQFESAAAVISTVGKTEMNPEGASNPVQKSFALQRLSDVHFDEEIGTSASHSISRSRLWVLASIGLLILAMACFNFINLATAVAAVRAREVGVRKAIGGAKSALVAQFMTETSLVVALSLALGVGLVVVFSPFLKLISDVPASQKLLTEPSVWLFLAVVGVVVALLSGLYPSFILAGLSPVGALKSNGAAVENRGGLSLRKGLVVAQFTIAQALIIGAVVTISQLNFIRNMDLGFKKDLVLMTHFNGDSLSQSKLETIKARLLQNPSIESVSFSADAPASGSTWATNFACGRGSKDADFSTSLKLCDADFQKTFGLKLLAGQWFEPSDTVKSFVVNETLCRKLGISPAENIIGKEIRLGGGRWKPVVGVVKDFHSHSLHRGHEPIVIAPRKIYYSEMGLKIRPENIAATTEAVRKLYDENFPEQVFESTFLDENVARFYQAETRFSAFCKAIAGLAVLIGCLGLFGLASHTARRRVKEIGIRKVLGASVSSLTALLARDFLKLVVVAIVLAAPVAIYFMRKWLADFAFRIEIEWWMVGLTALAAVAIAFLTVSFQSIRAALADPVKSLRSE